MKSFRILHVDDDPLMRDVVEIALGLDPSFMVMSCAGAKEALAVVNEWAPDLILCDVTMPEMDGPALLLRLRESASTAKFPLIFMTARAKASDVDGMIALGAAAVIAKPFDPATFAATVRRHLQTIKFASTAFDFTDRLRTDAAALTIFRDQLRDGSDSAAMPEALQSFAHKLAGAAGVFNFCGVSATASALEDAVLDQRAGRGAPGAVEANLDALLESIGHASLSTLEPAGRLL